MPDRAPCFHELASFRADAQVDEEPMRSWIFRHRMRLRAIYGPRPAVEQPPAGPIQPVEERVDGLAPGESAWHGRWYVIRPKGAA